MRVMRPWRGLGMILHTEQWQVPVTQAFESRVVQVDVRQLNFTLRQRIRIHREVMVMRRNLDLAALQLLHWMIPAVVPKLELESLSTQRNADKLMSQTNTKDRHSPHQPPNVVDGIRARLRIAWTVRQKNSIRLESHHIFRQSLCRNHGHAATFTAQLP